MPVNVLLANPANAKWRNYSIEFCGGTHLKNSRQAGEFVIASEESVSKGVRRIVALTASSAHESIERGKLLESEIKRFESVADADLPAAIKALQIDLIDEKLPLLARRYGQRALLALQDRHRKWEKSQKSSGPSIDVAEIASVFLKKGNVVVESIDNASDDQLRAVIDSIKKRSQSFAAMLAGSDGNRISFIAVVSDDLIGKGLKAGDWVRETAKIAGGGGGGRPQMAAAGGKDVAKLQEALAVAREYAGRYVG